MRIHFSLCALVLCTTLFAQTNKLNGQNSSYQSTDFGSGWFFTQTASAQYTSVDLDHTSWQAVQIPHTWNATDVQYDGQRGYYRGEGWYRKKFTVADTTEVHYLHFEGVNQTCSVFVNNVLCGTHVGGYTAFTIPISQALNSGENVVAVQVSNAHNAQVPPLSADFTFFGGIYRNVWLERKAPIHLSLSHFGSRGVYAHASEIFTSKANLRLRGYLTTTAASQKPKRVRLVVRLRDQSGKVVATKDTAIPVTAGESMFKIDLPLGFAPGLWSPTNPTVYRVEVDVMEKDQLLDHHNFDFGFRTVETDPNRGLLINGERVQVKGVNRHQDVQNLGPALTDDMHRRDLEMLKQLGANFLRTAHYPQANAVLEYCNINGIMVWEEPPLVNEVTLTNTHKQNSLNMLQEMVYQHYNHPSVVIWGLMNEIYWAHRFKPENELPMRNAYTVALCDTMHALAKVLDPLRPTAVAMHNYPAYEETGIPNIPDIASWNLYHGWYYDEYEDFGRFMDQQHQEHPDRVLFLSEYGAGGDARISTTQPQKFDFSNEGQLEFMNAFLQQIQEREYLSGSAIWNLFDFSSERRVDSQSHLNNKGLITHNRKPKDAYYLVQSYFTEQPYVHLAHNLQPTLVSFESQPGSGLWQGEVWAFANTTNVQLLANGKSYLPTSRNGNLLRFELELPAGEHRLCLRADSAEYCTTKQFEAKPLSGKDMEEIALNFGASYSFYEPVSNVHWLPAQNYTQGGFGFVGGKPLFVANKLGTKEDILSGDLLDPLYQTMQEGIESVQFDIPPGEYELELYFVEPYPVSRRFADTDTAVTFQPGQRIFSVLANEEPLINQLDLGAAFGWNVPYRFRTRVRVNSDSGLNLKWVSVKGEPVVSALRLRCLYNIR